MKKIYSTPTTEVCTALTASMLADSKSTDTYVKGGGTGIPSVKEEEWTVSEWDVLNGDW